MLLINLPNKLSVRQWSGRPEFNPRLSLLKDSKMVLDTALLNTQHYNVRIKGKVEQSREWSSALPYTSCVIATEKRAFGLPSSKVTNFIYIYI